MKEASRIEDQLRRSLEGEAWRDSAHRSLEGSSGNVSDEENFPNGTDTSEASWRAAVQSMVDSNRELREAIMNLEDKQLEGPVPGRDFPLYLLLHGVVQHNLYHAGQIALLKKGR